MECAFVNIPCTRTTAAPAPPESYLPLGHVTHAGVPFFRKNSRMGGPYGKWICAWCAPAHAWITPWEVRVIVEANPTACSPACPATAQRARIRHVIEHL